MATVQLDPAVSSDDWDMGSAFDSTHNAISIGRNATISMKYGIRFPSAPIPAGATITSAVLTFVAQQTRNDSPSVRIYGIAADNPTAPTNSTQEAALTRTTAYTSWTISAQTVDVSFNSPDISSPLQEIINRAGWAWGNALIITIDNFATDATRLASVHSRDSTSGTKAPYLTVTWIHPDYDGIQVAVSASGDDCVCPANVGGFTSGAGNIVLGRSSVSSKAFFRFQNITLKKNAIIYSARLVTRLTGTISTAPTLTIKGAAADNVTAPTNQTQADAISRTTASTAWNPSTGGSTALQFISPDFTSVVQEIVNRSGWASGNALGIFVEDGSSGSSQASVYTWDAQNSGTLGRSSPRLEVLYYAGRETHTTDALLKAVDSSKTHTTDASLSSSTPSVTHTTDALLKAVDLSKTHTTDASLKAVDLSKTHTTDASLFATSSNSITHTTDALLKAELSLTHTTDASLFAVSSNSITHTTDALLKAELSSTHTTDASLLATSNNSITHTTDALLKAELSLTHTADALLRAEISLTHTTDASLFTNTSNSITHTADALLKAELSPTHITDALLKAELSLTHTTDSRITQEYYVQHTTDALLFAIFYGSGNLNFEKFGVSGTAEYDGPGSGTIGFGQFVLSGSGVFIPFYRPSKFNIDFPKFGISGRGVILPPNPSKHPKGNVYKINRDYLRWSYGWGSIDRTLSFEWSDCCPGGEGAHPPQSISCITNPDIISTVYDFPNDLTSIRWLTCCPPCTPTPSMGYPVETELEEQKIAEIVHDVNDIKQLKQSRNELNKQPEQPPPHIPGNFQVDIRSAQREVIPGTIGIIDDNTPQVNQFEVSIVSPPQPTISTAVPEIVSEPPPQPKNFNVNTNIRGKRNRQLRIRVDDKGPKPTGPSKIEYISNALPTVKRVTTPKAKEPPPQKKTFSVGMRAKKRH